MHLSTGSPAGELAAHPMVEVPAEDQMLVALWMHEYAFLRQQRHLQISVGRGLIEHDGGRTHVGEICDSRDLRESHGHVLGCVRLILVVVIPDALGWSLLLEPPLSANNLSPRGPKNEIVEVVDGHLQSRARRLPGALGVAKGKPPRVALAKFVTLALWLCRLLAQRWRHLSHSC